MTNKDEFFNYAGIYDRDNRNDSEKPAILRGPKTQSLKYSDANTTSPYGKCQIDYSGRQFVCFHDQCIEHKTCFKNESQDAVFDFQALHIHPEDKALLCEKVFPDILRFMEQVPADQHPDYRLSFNHRYIRKDGTTSQFLQEGTLSISEDGHFPVLNLKVFTDIGDFKTDESMILSISRHQANLGYQKVWTRVYSKSDTSQLSQREIEIIKLCLEGLSSKMIANRLNLSIHTVKNHKRNCMEKTLTHNITELIHLCMRSHWL